MHYLYHMVPLDMTGDILYPLNRLKEVYPDLYGKKADKYIGREHLMKQIIPGLNCLWNDVLHFTAVHPQEIHDALVAAGQTDVHPQTYYQVDPALLEPAKSIVYLYAHPDENSHWAASNFEPYAPDDIAKYAVLTQQTKDYYKERLGHGRRPLLFHRVPHILYQGSLNVAGLPTLTV